MASCLAAGARRASTMGLCTALPSLAEMDFLPSTPPIREPSTLCLNEHSERIFFCLTYCFALDAFAMVPPLSASLSSEPCAV